MPVFIKVICVTFLLVFDDFVSFLLYVTYWIRILKKIKWIFYVFFFIMEIWVTNSKQTLVETLLKDFLYPFKFKPVLVQFNMKSWERHFHLNLKPVFFCPRHWKDIISDYFHIVIYHFSYLIFFCLNHFWRRNLELPAKELQWLLLERPSRPS